MITKLKPQLNADQTAIWIDGRVTARFSCGVPKQDPCSKCVFRKDCCHGACAGIPCTADERLDGMDGIWEGV